MPHTNPYSRQAALPPSQLCTISKDGADYHAHILSRRTNEVYVHYVNTDKRLDEWVLEEKVVLLEEETPAGVDTTLPANGHTTDAAMTEEEFDIEHHKQITATRNFEWVFFGNYKIKTWYFSPYPLNDLESDDVPSTNTSSTARIAGLGRSSARSHGRTLDLFAGALQRNTVAGEKDTIWVCDKCFKYMGESLSWELHTKTCPMKHPPGRKVYQRGAHTIWEVDGAKEKLYCQNLSLFGKLFIDVKTLFFDCDNFLFYLMTDADSQIDHVYGFFSKEKVSYDGYNLATIVVFPPFQRAGWGMMMIEFSYELSRNSGKIGTPERPLSDLGLRSYLAYWVAAIIRFLRRLLTVTPPQGSLIRHASYEAPSGISRSVSREAEDKPRKKRPKGKSKGWAGELDSVDSTIHSDGLTVYEDGIFSPLRRYEVIPNKDGSAIFHLVVKCTLEDISRATHIRVEDVAFAMNECGLLARSKLEEGEDGGELVVISRESVEATAIERRVKVPIIDPKHVML